MQDTHVPANSSNLGCLVRLGWMVVGNLALVLCLFGISQHSWQIINSTDVIYGITVVALIALRYVDVRYCAGTKSTGEPATLADWRAYSQRVLLLAAAAWCAARAFAWLRGPDLA
jgi:hypothetical protein